MYRNHRQRSPAKRFGRLSCRWSEAPKCPERVHPAREQSSHLFAAVDTNLLSPCRQRPALACAATHHGASERNRGKCHQSRAGRFRDNNSQRMDFVIDIWRVIRAVENVLNRRDVVQRCIAAELTKRYQHLNSDSEFGNDRRRRRELLPPGLVIVMATSKPVVGCASELKKSSRKLLFDPPPVKSTPRLLERRTLAWLRLAKIHLFPSCNAVHVKCGSLVESSPNMTTAEFGCPSPITLNEVFRCPPIAPVDDCTSCFDGFIPEPSRKTHHGLGCVKSSMSIVLAKLVLLPPHKAVTKTPTIKPEATPRARKARTNSQIEVHENIRASAIIALLKRWQLGERNRRLGRRTNNGQPASSCLSYLRRPQPGVPWPSLRPAKRFAWPGGFGPA